MKPGSHARSRARLLAVAALVPLGALPPAAGRPQRPAPKPALVVVLAIDQLSWDLFERDRDVFSGGFQRALERGRVFVNATHDHAITETSPGHATLGTGTFPSHHGMVANQWWERAEDGRWLPVTNVVDPTTRIVGAPDFAGASPAKLERSGLADWMRAANPRTRVVSLSGKNRAAVLLAGRSRDRVVWFEEAVGRFATSTFYADENPPWLETFNTDELGAFAKDSVWASTVPDSLVPRARADSATFEGDGVHTAFPHRFADARLAQPTLDFWTWWATTPPLDEATLRLARRAVDAEGLGRDSVPDLLAISLSQTDRVGHAFGPFSLEQLDNLLRLDRELGDFFRWLDQRVGPDRWLLALTADHGVVETPESRRARGLTGSRLSADSARVLQTILNETANRVGLDHPDELADALARAAVTVPWVARAWTTRELSGQEPAASPADSFAVLERNSLFPGRAAGLLSRFGVEMQLAPYALTWAYPRGSAHGSPYLYDRRVPLILVGAGVASGQVSTRVSTTDLAPTLARLLGVPTPPDLDGVPREVR